MKFIIGKALSENILNFNISGLNITKLDLDLFGTKHRKDNLYNRFFKTIVKGSLSYFYETFSEIKITKIYHDKVQLNIINIFHGI